MLDRVGLLRVFADRLEAVRLAAGRPSLARLGRLSPWLARSTTSDVLRGRSKPSLDLVVAFVQACRSLAQPEVVRAEPDLFDDHQWRDAWRELERQLGVLRRKAPPADQEERAGQLGLWPVPRQLPAAPYPFIGRESYLDLLNSFTVSDGEGGRPSAVAIYGAAGVGKTALVVHWGQHVAKSFPDGQLYVDLRGYGPGDTPIAAADAMRTMLETLHMPQVPADPDQMARLWRSVLAQRRLLVVLDNARSADQVRPMLASAAVSAVVLTSRHRLGGLHVRDGVTAISLPAMSLNESRSLMRESIGDMVQADPQSSERLAELCDHNPLAIRVLAENVAAHPRPLSQVLRELETLPPLDVLFTSDQDQSSAVRAVLHWSYQALPPTAAHLFRLLALHPGPHLCVEAATALAGTTQDATVLDLAELVNLHLLHEPAESRYQMHDLVRHLAHELLDTQGSPLDRDQATRRELHWYLYTAAAADHILMPGRRNLVDQPASQLVQPARFTGYNDALAWCDAERPNLVGIVRQAVQYQMLDLAWKLPTILLSYFNLRKAWTEWVTSFELALTAAHTLGDRYAQATILNALGIAHRELGHHHAALDYLTQAARTSAAVGMHEGTSHAWNNIGAAYNDTRKYGQAVNALRQALESARLAGSRHAEVNALHNLAESYLELGWYDRALVCASTCLRIWDQTGDHGGVGFALTSLGEIYSRTGRWDDAQQYLHAAIHTRTQAGDLQGTAIARFRLGRTYAARGDDIRARDQLRQARAILEPLGDPLADQVHAFQRRL